MTRLLVAGITVALLAGCPGGGTPDGGGTGGGMGVMRTTIPAPSGGQYGNPRWSPDGTKIAVHVSGTGANGADLIGTLDSAGMNLVVLADAGTYLANPAWGPNGTTIYFTENGGISQVPAAGGAATRIATPFAAMDLDVSADGNRLLFTRNGTNNVELREADGGTRSLHAGGAGRFSPDGTLVAFVGDVMSTEHFFVYRFSDGMATDLGLADTYLASVSWLPDGLSFAATSKAGIEIVGLDGGHSVIYSDAFASTGIDVSKDGKKIIYAVNGQAGLFVLTGF